MTHDQTVLCARCGFANTPGDQFCGSCGTFLEWEGTPATIAADPGAAASGMPAPATGLPGPATGSAPTTPVPTAGGPTPASASGAAPFAAPGSLSAGGAGD